MNGFQRILDGIDCMALYWQRRKMDFLIPASDEFSGYVDPACYYLPSPTDEQISLVNMCFTEWVLFERPLEQGGTPLELFVGTRPVALPKRSWEQLSEVAATQFFSRFSILKKDRATGICTLEDVEDGRVREVYDETISQVDRWRDGTIALRVAAVDGAWLGVGQVRLYDVAPAESTADDGPGAVHPEEREALPEALLGSFYLRLLHDTLGRYGRYSQTLRIREVEA